MNTPDAVANIVAILADAEAFFDKGKTELDRLPSLFKDINDNGDAGTLISVASSLRARSIGLSAKADLIQFHSDLTEAAKARGIDIPGTFSGGGR